MIFYLPGERAQYGSKAAIVADFKRDREKLVDSVLEDYLTTARESGEKRHYNRLGVASAQFGRYSQAEKAFNTALSLDRNYLDPRINLGNVYYLRQEFQQALKYYHGAEDILLDGGRKNSSLYFTVLLNISKTYYELENYDKATEYYETLVEDELSPVIMLTEPQNYGQYKSTITMSGVVEDSSTTPGDNQGRVSTLSYEVQGHYLLSGEIPFAADGQFGPVDIDATGLSGREVIVISAEDWNGNISEEEIILDEDTSGPMIDIPDNYSQYTNQVTISGTIANSQSDSTITEVRSITWEVISDPTLTETLTFDVSGDGTFTATPPPAATIKYYAPNDFDFTVNTVLLKDTQYIKVTAEDWNGHTTDILRTITDGKTGPYIEVSSPNNGESYHSTVTITGIVQNGQSDTGRDSVEFLTCALFVSGGDEGTITFTDPLAPTFAPDDGTITFNIFTNAFSITLSTTTPVTINDDYLRISIWAEDKTGKTTTKTIDLVKSGGPSLSINSPVPYTTTVSITGTVKSWDGALNAAEIDTLTYSLGAVVDQPLAFDAAGNIAASLTTSTLSGDQTLTIKATDDDGNLSQVSFSLTDGIDPQLVITAPVDNDSYDMSVNITATVRSNPGITGVCDIDSVSYQIGIIQGTLTYNTSGVINETIDLNSLSGTQTLTITAEDKKTPTPNESEVSVELEK